MSNEQIPAEEIKRIEDQAHAAAPMLPRMEEMLAYETGFIKGASREFLRHLNSKPSQGVENHAIAFHYFMRDWVPYHDNTYIPRSEFEKDRYPKYIDQLYALFLAKNNICAEAIPTQLEAKTEPFIALVRLINALNRGMVEYFRQHNYRAMWDVWRSLVDNLAPSPPSIQQEAIPEEEKTLGRILKEARVAKRMSVENVLEATGVSNEYLRKLEAGELKSPSASVLWKLAQYYGIDLKPLAIKAGIIIKAPPSPPSVKTEREDSKNRLVVVPKEQFSMVCHDYWLGEDGKVFAYSTDEGDRMPELPVEFYQISDEPIPAFAWFYASDRKSINRNKWNTPGALKVEFPFYYKIVATTDKELKLPAIDLDLIGEYIAAQTPQPSPAVQEGEPEDLKDWMDNHAECDSDEDATLWINGAKAMYRKLADDNAFCDSQIAGYSKQLAEEIQSLQSQLYNSQKEIKQLRGLLLETMVRMGLDLPCHEDLVDLFNIGMSGRSDLYCAISDLLYDKLEEPARLEPKEFILFNPIPQTPTNETTGKG